VANIFGFGQPPISKQDYEKSGYMPIGAPLSVRDPYCKLMQLRRTCFNVSRNGNFWAPWNCSYRSFNRINRILTQYFLMCSLAEWKQKLVF